MIDDSPIAALYKSLSARRRITKNAVLVFILAFLLLWYPASFRATFVLSLLVAATYVVVQVLAGRFCMVCGQPVFSLRAMSRAIECPACGGECQYVWRSHT